VRREEPYDARKVSKWIEDTYRPVTLPQSDHIWTAYELPSGRTVVVPGPSAAKRPVATGTARKIAAALGMTYEELRDALGHPIIRHSRPKVRTVTKKEPVGCSKRDVIARSREAHRALTDVEQAVKPGVRDAAFYGRVHQHLAEAKRLIDLALAEATSNGTRRSA